MSSAGSKDTSFKVHVSYSDVDIAFVERLVTGLTHLNRFEFSFSRHDAAPTGDWQSRIGDLVTVADTVLFVLSPDAARSKSFAWEAEQAHIMSKRLLCVVCRTLRVADLPIHLAGARHLRFDDEQVFERTLGILVGLLDADADWLRMHTQLFARARKWENAGCSERHLLSGAEVVPAKIWPFDRPEHAPKPTELHIRFILASEAAETARTNQPPEPGSELPHLSVPTSQIEQVDKVFPQHEPMPTRSTHRDGARRPQPIRAALKLLRMATRPPRPTPPAPQADPANDSAEQQASPAGPPPPKAHEVYRRPPLPMAPKVFAANNKPSLATPPAAEATSAKDGVERQVHPGDTPEPERSGTKKLSLQNRPDSREAVPANNVVIEQSELAELLASLMLEKENR